MTDKAMSDPLSLRDTLMSRLELLYRKLRQNVWELRSLKTRVTVLKEALTSETHPDKDRVLKDKEFKKYSGELASKEDQITQTIDELQKQLETMDNLLRSVDPDGSQLPNTRKTVEIVNAWLLDKVEFNEEEFFPTAQERPAMAPECPNCHKSGNIFGFQEALNNAEYWEGLARYTKEVGVIYCIKCGYIVGTA